MATRSRIAVNQQDGTIKSIYCHWDGHIETNGKILFENYDREKTEQLIALGNISSLKSTIEESPQQTLTQKDYLIAVRNRLFAVEEMIWLHEWWRK